mmetsp:Transcript_22775/g.37726  ORF Transcript_22775/g.37726 Transcript_22775/m.37726 type:complete len:100 (+) Transcript_22775:1069-1368(+)
MLLVETAELEKLIAKTVDLVHWKMSSRTTLPCARNLGGVSRKRATAFKSAFVESYMRNGTEYGPIWKHRGADQARALERIKKINSTATASSMESMATFL